MMVGGGGELGKDRERWRGEEEGGGRRTNLARHGNCLRRGATVRIAGCQPTSGRQQEKWQESTVGTAEVPPSNIFMFKPSFPMAG